MSKCMIRSLQFKTIPGTIIMRQVNSFSPDVPSARDVVDDDATDILSLKACFLSLRFTL